MSFHCATISRNTLANANATPPWQIYADLVQHQMGIARPLYTSEQLAVQLDVMVYAFDATTIDLVCRCFLGHRFAAPRQLRSRIPTFIHITYGKTHEVCDQTGILPLFYACKDYLRVLRRVMVKNQ